MNSQVVRPALHPSRPKVILHCKRCGGRLCRGLDNTLECLNCSAEHTQSGDLITRVAFAPHYMSRATVPIR